MTKKIFSKLLLALIAITFFSQAAYAAEKLKKVDVNFAAISLNSYGVIPTMAPCYGPFCYLPSIFPFSVLQTKSRVSVRGWKNDTISYEHSQALQSSGPILSFAYAVFTVSGERYCNDNLRSLTLFDPDHNEIARQEFDPSLAPTCGLFVNVPQETTFDNNREPAFVNFRFRANTEFQNKTGKYFLVAEYDGETSGRTARMPLTFEDA